MSEESDSKKTNNLLDSRELCIVAINMINDHINLTVKEIDGIKVTVSNLRTAKKFSTELLKNFSKINLAKALSNSSIEDIDKIILQLNDLKINKQKDAEISEILKQRGISSEKIAEILKS